MENRAGYKKTEIGWIPKDWEFNNLYSVSHKIWIGLVTTMTTNYVDYGTPLIRNNNIKENYIQKNEMIFLRNDFAEEHNSRRVKKGDIVSVHTGDICTSAIIDDELDGAHGFATLNTTVKKNIISNTYLCWYLNSVWAKKQAYALATGDGRGNLNMKDFKKITLPIPPLPEQQKIASILTTVDDKISSIESQIQQTEQLKKGLMAKLLTEGIGHTEFKDTEIGRIPESWEVTELSNIIKTTQLGINIQASTSKIGIPLLKMGNLTIGGFNFSKIEKISDTDISPYTDFILKKGDFLFNTRNSPELVGKSAVWKSDELMLFNSNILRIIFLENTNSFFIAYFFASDIGWKKLKQISKNTTSVGAIYSKDLLKIKIAIPPLQEQQQIASILSSVDDKLDVLQSKKTSYSTLKKGLMAKLLTGQMRVKIS